MERVIHPFVGVVMVLLVMTTCPAAAGPTSADADRVRLHRLPDGGVQPQAVVDGTGAVHLTYLGGEPMHCDVFYVHSTDGGETFSEPIRVNSGAGSAIAVGAVRGAHLAAGRDGWVHVAWMASHRAEPTAPDGSPGMLYARARLTEGGGVRFEPQRNVIDSHPGLDGGGSVAADGGGNVFVAWHAPDPTLVKGKADEQSRRVWVSRSSDDGETFAPEVAASEPKLGACACCGMRAIAAGGKLYVLFRSATKLVDRDTWLIGSEVGEQNDEETRFGSFRLAPMKANVCIMSTAAFARGGGDDVFAAWQTGEQIDVTNFAAGTGATDRPWSVPGKGKNRKHPALAVNRDGEMLIAWTENTGWATGGRICWQLFARNGKPVRDAAGHADDLPPWGTPAVFESGGRFVVVY